METYVKRIGQLEEIAKGFDGVQQAYAMQAGREIRVMVIPEKVSDADAVKMAQEMREKIESTMTYPGRSKCRSSANIARLRRRNKVFDANSLLWGYRRKGGPRCGPSFLAETLSRKYGSTS
jgi:hypothetical protein